MSKETCCGGDVKREYMPTNRRLIEYGKEASGAEIMEKFNYTKMWVFTFIDSKQMCIECKEKYLTMLEWFEKYELLDNPVNNVKWVVDPDMNNNLIAKDLHLIKSPTTLFCDSNGNIFNMHIGFPDTEMLEEYILPYVRV